MEVKIKKYCTLRRAGIFCFKALLVYILFFIVVIFILKILAYQYDMHFLFQRTEVSGHIYVHAYYISSILYLAFLVFIVKNIGINKSIISYSYERNNDFVYGKQHFNLLDINEYECKENWIWLYTKESSYYIDRRWQEHQFKIIKQKILQGNIPEIKEIPKSVVRKKVYSFIFWGFILLFLYVLLLWYLEGFIDSFVASYF